jgi:hypothetical protein
MEAQPHSYIAYAIYLYVGEIKHFPSKNNFIFIIDANILLIFKVYFSSLLSFSISKGKRKNKK